MFNLLKSDVYRLVHGKMLWVVTGALLAGIALFAGLMHLTTEPQFLYDAARLSTTITIESASEGDEVGVGNSGADDDEMSAEEAREMTNAAQEAARAAAESSSAAAAMGNGVPLDEAEGVDIEFSSMPDYSDDMTVADFEGVSREMRTMATPAAALGDTLISGGFTALLTCLVIALYFASDFSTKFARNLPLDRRGRKVYYGERLLLVGLISLYFLVVGTLAVLAAFAVAGFTYAAADTAGELALYLLLSWLCVSAYGCVTAALVWATRSAGAGIAFALVVATGFAGALISSAIRGLAVALPVLSNAPSWLLSSCMGGDLAALPATLLAAPDMGAVALVPAVRVALVALFWLVASAALSLGLLKKRDV